MELRLAPTRAERWVTIGIIGVWLVFWVVGEVFALAVVAGLLGVDLGFTAAPPLLAAGLGWALGLGLLHPSFELIVRGEARVLREAQDRRALRARTRRAAFGAAGITALAVLVVGPGGGVGWVVLALAAVAGLSVHRALGREVEWVWGSGILTRAARGGGSGDAFRSEELRLEEARDGDGDVIYTLVAVPLTGARAPEPLARDPVGPWPLRRFAAWLAAEAGVRFVDGTEATHRSDGPRGQATQPDLL